MGARVTAAGRLHFGFLNLSLAHERLYGGLGVALSAPRVEVTADPAPDVDCDHETAAAHAERTVDRLGVPGARVRVEREIPRHVGLGSGTQLALATLAAIARTHDREPAIRETAPALGRGGRSGVGVAAFGRGGFVVDAGHPADRFTTDRPDRGSWTVPPPIARHDVPADWRFLVVVPAVEPGPSDAREDERMRAVVEDAEAAVADEIGAIVLRRLLPAIAEGDLAGFGQAVDAVGRLNGSWYAGEQGGVYRPPAGTLVAALRDAPAIDGAGQSSWGPTVYGVTDADRADDAEAAGWAALEAAGVRGDVLVARARNTGAVVEPTGCDGGRKR